MHEEVFSTKQFVKLKVILPKLANVIEVTTL